MTLGRKFRIWLTTFIIILFAFLLYRMFGDTGVIKYSKPDYDIEQTDMNAFPTDSNAGRVGQAKLQYVERARFDTVDVKTRKLKRVVGFEKVLHKSGNEWLLDKPYMNVFQDNLRCDITAKTGTVEIENVEGADPSPKQAVLKGNVIVHIIPQGKKDQSDSFIYLDEVTFDSDRSMFWSDNDVNFVSVDADLMGKGLEIVYNNLTNKLEYLKIRKIYFLNVKRLAQPVEGKRKTESQPLQVSETHVTPETPTAPKSSPVAESSNAAKKPAAEPNSNYKCLFRDNVTIEYKEEVILAEEVAITNLLWSQEKQQSQPSQQTQTQPQQQQQTQQQQGTVPAETPAVAERTEIAEPPAWWRQRPVIATVKCDGPMIVRPVEAVDHDEFKPKEFTGFNQLGSKIFYWLGQRNVLLAQQVVYNMASEIADSTGQTELVFYPEVDTAKGKQKLPFVINAKKGAQFLVQKKEAVFSGDVKGTIVKRTDSYDEENAFYGSKLIAYLSEKQGSSDIMASSDISHITIFGPKVRLESVRTLGKETLSQVRLKSERIDYDRATEDIIATGKGRIEYSNVFDKHTGDSTGQKTLNKPCFALVEGFDKLIWDTNSLHVRALSDKTKGIHIGYLPIIGKDVNGRDIRGRTITVDTRQADIDYFEPVKGKAQLKRLDATGGIVYVEQGRYEFVGKDLFYNALEDFMTVSGSPEMPCMLNGMIAEGIEYNLKTGAASAVSGGGIGVMPAR